MRIALCNRFARQLGGTESYLRRIVPALVEAGHELATLFEMDAPAGRPAIVEHGAPVWNVARGTPEQTLAELRRWRPEVIFTHGISDPGFEHQLIAIAPAVHFAHDYSAVCISGTKSHRFPRRAVCTRPLDGRCLFNYFPRRCGGRSPVTMLQSYRLSRARLANLQRYHRILVASQAVRAAYLRNGLHANRIEVVRLPVASVATSVGTGHCPAGPSAGQIGEESRANSATERAVRDSSAGYHVHLLFAGRMVPLKGGELLLEALRQVAARLKRAVTLTMAGDGGARPMLEKQARKLCARHPAIKVDFHPWLEHAELIRLFRSSDLLVMPSLWPEPFGVIGPEAGIYGLPAAAFAVGGIGEWLIDGVNGFLAPADPPTSDRLALAIARCVEDPRRHLELRYGARQQALKFSLPLHISQLVEIFEQVINQGAPLELENRPN